MRYFWDFKRSEEIAFFLQDGSTISYAKLGKDVDSFKEKFFCGKGIFLLECDGNYRQFVSYLAALSVGCPILLSGKDTDLNEYNLSIKYYYRPSNDHFEINKKIGDIRIHPDLAVLLSTSGSTGVAKHVRLSYRNINSNAKSIVKYLEIGSDERASLVLPFNYSYGMSVVNSHLLIGASIVLTSLSVVEPEFWDKFRKLSCTSFAGVPHHFEMLELNQINTSRLRSLRYMTQAGGKLNPERVLYWARRSASEGWRFFVMYGQTEASPRISYLPPELAIMNPESIGISIPDGEITIRNEEGSQVQDGQQGELVYRGPNTMMGYARVDADLAEAQGSDTLHTGDIAIRQPNGLFHIVGRSSRFVKPFGLRVSLDAVEQKLQNMGLDVACGAYEDTMYVLVADRKNYQESLNIELISKTLSDWLKIPSDNFRIKLVDVIPRSSNGKVKGDSINKMIQSWAFEESHTVSVQANLDRSEIWYEKLLKPFGIKNYRAVNDAFRNHFPNQEIGPDATFRDLGGDSLNYLSVAIDLERIIGEVPTDWHNLSVRKLEKIKKRSKMFVKIDTATLLRAISIILIVSGHLDFFKYGGGGAYTLFFIAGLTFATFTIPKVLSDESSLPVVLLTLRVALLTVSFIIVNFVVTGYGELPAIFLVSNWFSPNVAGGIWFVEVYVQMLAIFALFLMLPSIRICLNNSPFLSSAIFSAILVGVCIVTDTIVDTNNLYNHLPHLMAWIFFCGITLHFAKNAAQRSVVSTIFFVGWAVFLKANAYYFVIACLLMIWIPSISTPRILTSLVREIANASLAIYLTHFQFASISEKLLGQNPVSKMLFAVIGGILLWKAYTPVDTFLCDRFYTFAGHQRAKFVK